MTTTNTETEGATPGTVSSTDWLDALAERFERRAQEWDGMAPYRDREIMENIANMYREMAKDIRATKED